MGKNAAYDLLPSDAVWSSSFGYPGEGGFNEYFRRPDGERWIISNGPWCGPVDWQCAKAPELSANVKRSLERHQRIFGG